MSTGTGSAARDGAETNGTTKAAPASGACRSATLVLEPGRLVAVDCSASQATSASWALRTIQILGLDFDAIVDHWAECTVGKVRLAEEAYRLAVS